MAKYIDADRLRYEIERRNMSDYHTTTERYEEELYEIIDSLELDESEVDDIKREWYNKGYLKGRQEAHIPARELGLPKALDFKPFDEDLERDAVNFCYDNGLNTTPHIAKTIAKHFYELGLNTRE